jgi:hypothetical protein
MKLVEDKESVIHQIIKFIHNFETYLHLSREKAQNQDIVRDTQ